jgi:hypothetical protein
MITHAPCPRHDPVQVIHRITCRHRVEVEIFPARATLYWQDEANINPIDTQIRFDFTLFNAEGGVTWQVLAPDGTPGAGAIDSTGLYQAPDKGGLPSGTTDVVVVTARADPLRKASAWITLVGNGPAVQPQAKIEIWPKRNALYYQSGANNDFIDPVNKQRLFRAFLTDSPDPHVHWFVDGVAQGGNAPWFLYQAPNAGGGGLVTVTAQIASLPAVQDDAKIILENYDWPGL